jgi:predicted nucleotidyltransferase
MVAKTTQQKDEIGLKFVNRITSLFTTQITRVIFFGSRAKGIPTPGSDYDFLIVLKEKNRTLVDEIYNVVTDFLIDDGADISLKIYGETEFQKMASIPTPFWASIQKTGMELWNKRSVN